MLFRSKRAISKFQRQEGATTAKSYMVTQDATEHQIDLDVTVYVGDRNKANEVAKQIEERADQLAFLARQFDVPAPADPGAASSIR